MNDKRLSVICLRDSASPLKREENVIGNHKCPLQRVHPGKGRALTACRSLQVPAAANGPGSSPAAENMMRLGSAEVGLGVSGLGLEIAKLLCRVKVWEESLNEEVRERETNEMAHSQAVQTPARWGCVQRTFRNKSVLLPLVSF